MTEQTTLTSTRPPRLGLKLLGIFAVAFAASFVVFFAYGLLSSYAEGNAVETNITAQIKPIVIDPNIESHLAKVLADANAPLPADVNDVFIDRAGLAAKVPASATGGTLQFTSPFVDTRAGSTIAGPGPGPVAPSAATRSQSAGSGQMSAPPVTAAPPAQSPIDATRQRYVAWLEHGGARGDVALDPRIFAIEDLVPVGLVDGGKGGQEVMFHSEAIGKTVSFPQGTMFFDGWLTELRPEGVVFSFNDAQRTVRLRTWARS